jgi:hypothetical protein
MTGRVGRAKSPDTGIGTYRARLRHRGNLLNRLNVICPVQPRLRKYSCFHVTRLESISPAVQSYRGAYPDRQRRGAGCGGRGGIRRET